ncbi:MAG: DUF4149 domain-containing protein [Myxococcales bacterium]|nr:DUF4149 domain-containing protein [Myxococcales bacterium]MCB9537479.1 DUF4149 domain-containing protein [Myxococcales bacterium]
MHALYLVSVWLHILAATAWIGGMFFLVLVVVPWLRSGGRRDASTFLRETGVRFRKVGWICFGVLVATGTLNLWFRGIGFADLAQAEWRASPFGRILAWKLGVFAVVLIVSALHDFYVGPHAARVIGAGPDTAEAARARRRASLLGRANMLLALVLVAVGVMLVRGAPL